MSAEDKMLYVGGSDSSFRCDCGANVFHQPASEEPDLYECNGCQARWRSEREQKGSFLGDR